MKVLEKLILTSAVGVRESVQIKGERLSASYYNSQKKQLRRSTLG